MVHKSKSQTASFQNVYIGGTGTMTQAENEYVVVKRKFPKDYWHKYSD